MNSNLCWPLVRLAVLLGVFLVQSSEEASYKDFLHKHVDPKGPGSTNLNAYCNQLMAQRGMTTPKCTPWNIFFNAKPFDLQQVCGRGRHTRSNLRDSKKPFRLVICRSTRSGGCQYRGWAEHKRIRLACFNNQPVQFDKRL